MKLFEFEEKYLYYCIFLKNLLHLSKASFITLMKFNCEYFYKIIHNPQSIVRLAIL